MTDETFLDAIRADPEDSSAYLAYADWLEERGDVRAEFLRVQADLLGLRRKDPRGEGLRARLGRLRRLIDPDWLVWVDRSDRFTMLWPADVCRLMERAGQVGRPLRALQGGHNQDTRFSKMNVRAGDYLHPVRVKSRKLYVVARMRVAEVTTPEEYARKHPAAAEFIRPGCAGEVLAGTAGTPVRFDREVPTEVLERLTFRSTRGQRRLKHVKDGLLTNAVDVQGIFRLTVRSAMDFELLLRDAPGEPGG
jgi:uncharacterized protein (TIGR02996 family)